jgi:uncharacterized protein with von Willebrand factor type A (vWA) domain
MSPAEIALTAVVTIMGGGNIWGWLSSRGKTKVDLIQLGQTIAAATITAQQNERRELLHRIDQMDATIENQGLKIEELTAHITKLEDVIRGLGGTPPSRPRKAPA